MNAIPVTTDAPEAAALALAERARASGVGPSAVELAELIGAFNTVTSRLQATHEELTGEVGRLQGELREANERLRRARELAALGEMAAGIAHEVRNPLGSIRLYASALEDDLADRPSERRLARRIGAAVRGLDAVVSDVLTFARERRVDRAPVPVGHLIDHAVASCADLVERAGTQIQTPTEAADDPCALCDAALAQQALTNILRNAVEAIEGVDGERVVHVTVCTCHVRGARPRRRPMVVISVRDTGPGVPEDVMERMFNPFFTTRAAGTGLGLAIVHRIADAHDGRVTVRNHEDGGAVVELMLPAATPEQESRALSAHTHGGEA